MGRITEWKSQFQLAAGLELQFFQAGTWPVQSYPDLIKEGTIQEGAEQAKKPFFGPRLEQVKYYSVTPIKTSRYRLLYLSDQFRILLLLLATNLWMVFFSHLALLHL